MRDQLLGSTQPVLSISLQPGENIVAEAGEFAWMTDSIQLTARPAGLSDYTAKDQAGTIAFASRLPGSILHIQVTPGHEYLVHRNGFLAGTPGIEVTIGFQQPLEATETAAEMFILRRIGGRGRAWVELSGDVIRRDLAAGTSLRTHLGTSACRMRLSPCRWPSLSGLPPLPGHGRRGPGRPAGPGTVWRQRMPLLAGPHRPFPVRDALTQSSQQRGKQEHDPYCSQSAPSSGRSCRGRDRGRDRVLAGCGGSSSSGTAAGNNAASSHLPPLTTQARVAPRRQSPQPRCHPRSESATPGSKDHLWQDRQEDDRGDAGLRRSAGDDVQRHHELGHDDPRHRLRRGRLGWLDLAAIQPVDKSSTASSSSSGQHLLPRPISLVWPGLPDARRSSSMKAAWAESHGPCDRARRRHQSVTVPAGIQRRRSEHDDVGNHRGDRGEQRGEDLGSRRASGRCRVR